MLSSWKGYYVERKNKRLGLKAESEGCVFVLVDPFDFSVWSVEQLCIFYISIVRHDTFIISPWHPWEVISKSRAEQTAKLCHRFIVLWLIWPGINQPCGQEYPALLPGCLFPIPWHWHWWDCMDLHRRRDQTESSFCVYVLGFCQLIVVNPVVVIREEQDCLWQQELIA